MVAKVNPAVDQTVKNSTYDTKNGRYVLGGLTEVSSFAIEWWERANLQADPTDIIYVMEKKYEGRPDLLGYMFYGDPGLWWVIGQYNTIQDPNVELVEGKVLIIPTKERLSAQLFSPNLRKGGTPSTRIK